MRRALGLLLTLLVAGGLFVALGGAGGDDAGDGEYTVELDNAFGLVDGADVKVAGVRAGSIQGFDIDPKTRKALVHIKIDKQGFGDLRTDVFCSSRPQSLIGEYFIDCDPGTAKTKLKPGSTIPVTHTFSTIAPDLVVDVMRLPYRQRLRIILNELGATFAGSSQDLNDTIRRAVPALRETDNALAILAQQNHTIAGLAKNADKVITALADNRSDVQRFIDEAGKAASATAERDRQLAAGFHKLPGFLEQLKPAMRDLGAAASAQVPALRNLDRSANELTRFFGDLGPFSKSSDPAIKTLGAASVQGKQAVDAAPPVVKQLTETAKPTPELGKNLAIVLEHLDNRDFAIEEDARSPGGKGFTGLEALLQYAFVQSQAINIFDGNSYKLKVNLFVSPECSFYADDAEVSTGPPNYDLTKLGKDCGSYIGPNQIGITEPDPTAPGNTQAAARSAAEDRTHAQPGAGDRPTDTASGTGTGTGTTAGGGQGGTGGTTLGQSVQKLLGGLTGKLGDTVNGVAKGVTGALGGSRGGAGSSPRSSQALLDFLLGP